MKAPAERRLPQFCGFWSELGERSCWSWPDPASCGNWLQTEKIHRSLKGPLKPGEWIKSAKKHLILVHNQSWRWERRDVASNETHFKSESCTFTFLPPNSWLLLYRALSFPFYSNPLSSSSLSLISFFSFCELSFPFPSDLSQKNDIIVMERYSRFFNISSCYIYYIKSAKFVWFDFWMAISLWCRPDALTGPQLCHKTIMGQLRTGVCHTSYTWPYTQVDTKKYELLSKPS